MGDAGTLLWGVVFGSIGLGYFVYGKKQARPVPLLAGMALCVLPYVVPNPWLMIALGIALMAVPYFYRP